ncbi:3-beta-hydroxysteroid sulfotransferase-like isoform X2 [Peromyscus maniculatus bairdii]|uniref:3-beta-hydroxysteroid sulfotransferase-like isoform X2 n=1 Tax=Peromyscus maniculatus bairdii TaxID=230844 RepID=UPI003FD4F6CC
MTDNIFLFEGIQMLSDFLSEESLSFAQNFLVKDDDVIIVSFPRSGTHWMIEMISLIVSKGDPTWVQTVKNFARSPGLESKDEQKLLLDQAGPRLMSTHLPIQLFPKSYFTSSAKVIYVIRNPRDVVISYYHIRKHFHLLNNQQTFDEYLPAFIQVVFGSWFDHTLGWLTRRDTENFLLMSYEELQRDLKGSMQKVCQFLGKYLTPEQLDSAARNLSFSVMKENSMSNSLMLRNPKDGTISNIPLLRKGICGDWKNFFTVTQSEAFDRVYQEKMSRLDPGLFPWHMLQCTWKIRGQFMGVHPPPSTMWVPGCQAGQQVPSSTEPYQHLKFC